MGSADNSFGMLGVTSKATQTSISLPSVHSQIIVWLEAKTEHNEFVYRC